MSSYESSISNQEDLFKENDQQMKTIRRLDIHIKLLWKSQKNLLKTTNQTERDNKKKTIQEFLGYEIICHDAFRKKVTKI
ncbi:unnamed protein product [Adineta ricciae]|uniref:Uncharacterized protein n=1 Tax=Adineta ricciae TaxID=249248 RepID=A0A813W080_ADIRI|nr:unnamed protein product [Adineta ricciae]